MLLVPGHCLLVGVRDLADRRLVERLTRNLQPDRQPVGIETAWQLVNLRRLQGWPVSR
jgi:hypothetical protein